MEEFEEVEWDFWAIECDLRINRNKVFELFKVLMLQMVVDSVIVVTLFFDNGKYSGMVNLDN
jgi:hypothetical protein